MRCPFDVLAREMDEQRMSHSLRFIDTKAEKSDSETTPFHFYTTDFSEIFFHPLPVSRFVCTIVQICQCAFPSFLKDRPPS